MRKYYINMENLSTKDFTASKRDTSTRFCYDKHLWQTIVKTLSTREETQEEMNSSR